MTSIILVYLCSSILIIKYIKRCVSLKIRIMILELIQTIVDYSGLNDQIALIQVDSYTYNNTYIYKLVADNSCESYVDQNVLEQEKFSKMKILDCTHNIKIYDVNHLSDVLEELYCNGSGMDQEGISKLKKLRIIHCGNTQVANLNHLLNNLVSLQGQPCTQVC